jgi:hypothetical protein
MRQKVTVAVVVASLAALGVVGASFGYPRVFAPLPMVVVIPQFWSLHATHEARSLRWVTEYGVPGIVGPVLLLLWNPRLLRGSSTYPRRSTIGLAILSLLSAAWFWAGWSLGVKYEGLFHVLGTLALNAAALTGAWMLALRARRRPSANRNLMAHWLVVAWLVWVAFPWLGELL